MSEDAQFQYYALVPAAELPNGERLFIEINERPIVVFNIAGDFYAIGDICTHDDGPLGDGRLEGSQVICPRQGARFDVRTGQALRPPAAAPAPSYPVRVVDGLLEIGIPQN